MSRKSPALSSSASAPGSGPSQATFGSAARQVSQEGINAEDIRFRKASQLSSSALEFGDLHCRLRGNRNHDPLRTKKTSIPSRNHDPSRAKQPSIPNTNHDPLRTKQPSIPNRNHDPLRKKQGSIPNRNHDPLRTKQASIPPKFNLNADWQVAAGGQSQERRVQEQREAHVTEVIYPHPFAIPNSPSISLDVEEGHSDDDDHDIPIIPITAIEDDEADSSRKIEADVAAAATVALTVLMKSKEQGSLIDTDLLIKILSEPKMVELLKVAQPSDNEKATVQHEVKQENSCTIQPALDRPPVLNSKNLLSSASRDPVKVAKSFGNEKATVQHEVKQENSYPIQPALDRPPVLNSNSPLSSDSRNPVKDAQSFGYEKAKVQQEVKQENSYTIQPALGRPPVLNSNNLLSSASRAPVKEGSIKFPIKARLLSDISAMTLAEAASSSVPPPCPVPDMLVPMSVRPLPKKLENLVHGSFPVPKLLASSVAMPNRAPIIPLQEDPRSRFPTPPPQLSSLPSAALVAASAYKSSFSGQPSQPIRDASYYKSLVRQHGVERRELHGQFGNQLNLREPENLSTHVQRQGHGMLTTSSPAPCIYFNSPTGCCLGLSCLFRHEFSYALRGLSNSHSCKRAKLN